MELNHRSQACEVLTGTGARVAKLEPMERLALPWGNARQFTKLLLSLLSHIGKIGVGEKKAWWLLRLRRGRKPDSCSKAGMLQQSWVERVTLCAPRCVCRRTAGRGLPVLPSGLRDLNHFLS